MHPCCDLICSALVRDAGRKGAAGIKLSVAVVTRQSAHQGQTCSLEYVRFEMCGVKRRPNHPSPSHPFRRAYSLPCLLALHAQVALDLRVLGSTGSASMLRSDLQCACTGRGSERSCGNQIGFHGSHRAICASKPNMLAGIWRQFGIVAKSIPIIFRGSLGRKSPLSDLAPCRKSCICRIMGLSCTAAFRPFAACVWVRWCNAGAREFEAIFVHVGTHFAWNCTIELR